MASSSKKILVFSSNPGRDLNTDKELNVINNLLKRKSILDFQLQTVTATKLDDVQSEIIRHQPEYIHFSGHAEGEKGLKLQNDAGKIEYILPATLGAFFSEFAKKFRIECVILNACASESLARAIAQHVGYVIGIRSEIYDDDAVQFSRSFYSALIDGMDVQGAFQIARAQLTNADPVAQPLLIIGKVSSGQHAYDGEPLSVRISKYGLVDLALHRHELTWKYLSKQLDDLIDKMPAKSEYFIVARSLELWMKESTQTGKSYLERLAKKVVSHQLRCIFVLPDKDEKLKSLVLNDDSQRFRDDLWNRIETQLKGIITDAAFQGNNDPEYGILEIYTIPAYVPSTFSRIATSDGVEYCSLEVGIGIPPDDARVLLYFENKKEQISIFERLTTIYRNIIAERKPAVIFPASKNKHPEDKELLSKVYTQLRVAFCEGVFRYDKLTKNRDWFNSDQIAYDGNAACVATLPLGRYLGGNEMVSRISELKRSCSAIIARYPDQVVNFRWLEDEAIHIPIFDYKTSFNGHFELSENEAAKLTDCISSREPFSIEFRHFIIDTLGRVMLLGYIASAYNSNTESLSKLRDDLLQLSKIEYKHFDARRPQIISCVIGSINNEIAPDLLVELKKFIQQNFELPVASVAQIEIDQLRLIRLRGQFANYDVEDVDKSVSGSTIVSPIVLKTILLEKYRENYGIITTGKWLAHDPIVKEVSRCAFSSITPITVHFSPSLSCIYHCPTCSYGCSKSKSSSQGKPLMSNKHMKDSIEKLANGGVKGLIFTGGGEPLVNKHSIQGMKYAKNKRMSVGLFTNGYLLDENKSYELFSNANEAPDFIRISINAGRPDAYRLIHGSKKDGLSTVLKNLETLCKSKLTTGTKTNIDIGVLITPAILDNLIDLAIEIKRLSLKYPGALNSILIRPAISYVSGSRENNYAQTLQKSQVFGEQYRRFIKLKKQFDSAIFQDAIGKIKDIVRPLLMNKGPSNVNVFLPEARFNQASKPDNGLTQCLACNLVIFIAPDTGVYRCVERALEPSMLLGKLCDVAELKKLLRPEENSISTKDCPPVCLLYETNIVWQDIHKRHSMGQQQELDHRIDMAKEYFNRYSVPTIGNLVNFI